MKRLIEQGLGGPSRQSFCAFSPSNRGASPSWHINVFTNPEAPLSFGAQSFRYIDPINESTGHATELHLQSPFPPWKSGWLKVPVLYNLVVALSGDHPHPEGI